MSLNKIQGKPSTSEAQKSSWTPSEPQCKLEYLRNKSHKETPLGRHEDEIQTGL